MAALVEAFFDESEAESMHRLLCVGGYLFKSEKSQAFELEWREALTEEKLPYFRMSNCTGASGVFKGRSPAECDRIARRFFDILKRHLECGFAASLDLRFAHLLPKIPPKNEPATPYAFACFWCLQFARLWALHFKYEGDILYTFENGYAQEASAAQMMDEIFKDKSQQERFFSKQVAFLDKKSVVQLQAADIFAWQWRKAMKDAIYKGKGTPRKDFQSLAEKPHYTIHFNEERFLSFRRAIQTRPLDLSGFHGMAPS